MTSLSTDPHGKQSPSCKPSRVGQVACWIGASLICGMGLGCVSGIYGDAPFTPPSYWDEEHFDDVAGHRICYLESGTRHSQTVIFIHGWSGNLQNWWDQYEDLSNRYHVVVFDLPGHGKSSRGTVEDYTLEFFMETTHALMDALEIPSATIVGNSMGGAVAMLLAARHPERVEALLVSDATGSGHNGRIQHVKRIVTANSIRGVIEGIHYSRTIEKNRSRVEFVRSYLGTIEARPFLEMLASMLAGSLQEIGARDLASIQSPTMIVWGEDDPVMPTKGAMHFHRAIAQSELYWVHKGGHTPNMNNAAEFNCVLERFLAGSDPEICHPHHGE